jgi:hypothetical protein
MSLLRDINHSIEWRHLPRRAKAARKKIAADEGRGRTELLRQALLDYRAVFDGTVGRRRREAILAGRRQVA